MTFHHLSYLQQVSDILEDHTPLAAKLGYIAKKISQKNLVHVKGYDVPKLKKCKACQAPITCDNVKIRKKSLIVVCQLCGFERKFSVVIDKSSNRLATTVDKRSSTE